MIAEKYKLDILSLHYTEYNWDTNKTPTQYLGSTTYRTKLGKFIDNLYAPIAFLFILIYFPLAIPVQLIITLNYYFSSWSKFTINFFTRKWKDL